MVIKQPKLFHPFTIDPLPPPNLQQGLFSSTVITFIHLICHPSLDVHQISDIDLNSFAMAESIYELFSTVYPYSRFALFQEIAIYEVDEVFSEWQFDL